MAVFNLDFYNGSDLYTDGDIENVILDIVKSQQDYKLYVGSDNYYPIMYHLSPERENILNWYPFKKTDVVLEVGSGCGAITGLLCEKNAWVTSVELSKRRAKINYERHKAYENLEIIVGNLNNITLEKKYDYVILTGVFEYAGSFTDSKEPYAAFLNKLKQYLVADGKILMSIENRLGIKYFSGALEDHTNEYYLGLKNYPGNTTVRTFSKTELEGIFRKCNLGVWKFYYPYPDYKFPTEIFTDENISSGNYGRVYRNYQKGRVELFDELKMAETFKNEHVMDVFANSFLVEMSLSDIELSNVVYAKLNRSRKEAFCIFTTILKNEGKYTVQKKALNARATEHINNIYTNQYKSLPLSFGYLEGKLRGDCIEYPYLSCETLDESITRMIETGDRRRIEQDIEDIYRALMSSAQENENIYNAQFKEYFGDAEYSGSLECIKDCNIDLIFDNLYPQDNGYLVIDPEWVCPFWVPVKFVFWRMINEWYAKHSEALEMFPSAELYMKYGITKEMEDVFHQWAVYFATKYVSDADLDRAAVLIQPMDVNQALKEYQKKNAVNSSLYIDYGDGFSEAKKQSVELSVNGNQFSFKVLLDSSKQIQALRWDPVESRFCRCNIAECYLDKQEIEAVPCNSDAQDQTLFLNVDPQFMLSIQPGKYSELEMKGSFECVEFQFVERCIGGLKEEKLLLESECEKLQDQNYEMQKNQVVLEDRNCEIQKNQVALEEKNTVIRNENENLYMQNEELTAELMENKRLLENIRAELDGIKNSRTYRVLSIWKRIYNYFKDNMPLLKRY